MKKRIIITVVLCIALTLTLAAGAYATDTDSGISIYVDEELTVLDTAPVRVDSSIDSSIYVPMLSFCEKMGAKVLKWDESSQSALAVFREFAVDATAGDIYITANGRSLYVPYTCQVIDGVLMVPVETIAKALNASCSIDGNVVTISSSSEIIESGSTYYNETELYWLARIIWAEAGNQSMTGKIAVGNVIMNRVHLPQFPNNVYDVIFDTSSGVQFSPIINGSIYNNPTADCYLAAKLAMEGARPVGDCLFFASIPDCWAAYNRTYYTTIGGHDFYL